MLPGMSGYAVCEALREIDRDLPVLILSARTLAEDRTRGFDVGANQYMTKPFDLDEFLSRVRNLLAFLAAAERRAARSGAASVATFEFANVEDRLREVPGPVGDEPVRLTQLEMSLLAVLRGEPGPGHPPPRAAGERLADAGEHQHPGPRPVHPPAAEALRARSGPAAALPHHPRRRLPFRGRGGGGGSGE